MLDPTLVAEGTLEVPVRFEITTSMKPDVVDALAPTRTHPFENWEVEVARVTKTVSPETTPVAAQKYGALEEAASEISVPVRVQVPFMIVVTAVPLEPTVRSAVVEMLFAELYPPLYMMYGI